MYTFAQALKLIIAYLDRITGGEAEVLTDATLYKPYGWVFFYQSKAYLQSGDTSEMFARNAPLIFNRYTGGIRGTGTAWPLEEYLEKYERTLPASQLVGPPAYS